MKAYKSINEFSIKVPWFADIEQPVEIDPKTITMVGKARIKGDNRGLYLVQCHSNTCFAVRIGELSKEEQRIFAPLRKLRVSGDNAIWINV